MFCCRFPLVTEGPSFSLKVLSWAATFAIALPFDGDYSHACACMFAVVCELSKLDYSTYREGANAEEDGGEERKEYRPELSDAL